MKQQLSASEIARNTLVQLAKNSLPPTPENYTAAYNKILGKTEDTASLSNKTLPETIKTDSANDVNWAVLIRTLLKKLETSHKGTTLTRKKDGLCRVLTNFAKEPVILAEKIQALMESWGNETATIDVDTSSTSTVVAQNNTSEATSDHIDSQNTTSLLQDMLIKTVDLALIPFVKDIPKAHKSAQELLQQLRSTTSGQVTAKSVNGLKDILFAIETKQENDQDVHRALINLLSLLVKSMSELSTEDKWLNGHLTILNDVLNKPINITSLGNAESSLKELIHKQSNLKPALHDAQDLIKNMAEIFISRLVDMTESTGEYHQKIENYQHKLVDIDSIDELNDVLKNVLEDTRSIGLTVQRTREEFNNSQAKITQAELKIQELTSVLEYINEVANEDYLTGTLNRRGMDDALEREFSRADRLNTALCIAVMDIDHFKKINDKLGHSTGDEALTHFANIVKQVKRTTDILARYGGEEFLIILPNTEQDDAVKVIERVQRQLTKQFFMHSNDRVIITFSAGVAERIGQETPEEIIPRADAALYSAKRAGRNRVLAAGTQQSALIKALQK